MVMGEDGVYTIDGAPVYIQVSAANAYHLSGYSLAAYVDAYGEQYFDMTNWDALVAAADEIGLAPATEENVEYLRTVVTGNSAWGEDESYLPNYMTYDVVYADFAWENVGFLATGDYELVMITNAPIENPNYYVPYNLSSTYLVYEPMWEENKRFWDANGNEVTADSDAIATVTNTYCTTAETVSYTHLTLPTMAVV